MTSSKSHFRMDPRYSWIHRAHREGAGIGTSPGINPLTPYTSAANEYRASWIGADMAQRAHSSTPNARSRLTGEVLNNEIRALGVTKNTFRPPLADPNPNHHVVYLESSGLARSLATNIADHPTAIQVNGIRQERTEDVLCPGYVDGTNSYDARTLVGNWAEERCDKAYTPSSHKIATGALPARWKTTYGVQTAHAARKVLPVKGSSAATMYTHPSSAFSNGIIEASSSSNKEIVQLGGLPHVDYHPGDHRSASRPSGNYVNYQAGLQHHTAMVGGRHNELIPYETSSAAAFSDPMMKEANVPENECGIKEVPLSSTRCDLSKPVFQMRDPARDSKAKMLCQIKKDEFACDRDDAAYLKDHILGFPVQDKQKAYNLEEYRARWTKNAPELVAAGQVPCSEHRDCFKDFGKGRVEVTIKRPGHVGAWH